MRKGVFVLVLLALALVVAGCQGGGKGAASSSSTPFIGGSEGLRVSFVENAPPAEVLDNPFEKTRPNDESQLMKFDIILKVENAGEQDVTAGNIKTTIGGIYPVDFKKTNADLQNVLFSAKRPGVAQIDGVKKDPDGAKILGATEELTFKDLAYRKQLEGNAEFPIQADVCYKYATKAVGDFCMRQDLTRTQGGVCQAKGTKPVFSSGSPVQVTSVDESIGGRSKVILKFKIKTLGSGSFFKPDAAGTVGAPTCARGDFSKENFVKVTVNSGVADLTCSGFTGTPPTGDVRLTNGEGTVTCIQGNINVDAVQKATVTIEYNHLISASTKLLVKHLPGFEGGTTAPAAMPSTPSSPSTSESPQIMKGSQDTVYVGIRQKCANTGGSMVDVPPGTTEKCVCTSGKTWNNAAGCSDGTATPSAVPPPPPAPAAAKP